MTNFIWGLLIGYLIGNIGAFLAICLFLNKRINEQGKTEVLKKKYDPVNTVYDYGG